MSTTPGIKFIYIFCNDLQAMRYFYTNILGLNEIYYSDPPDGTVAYDCDGLQFTIINNPKAQQAPKDWAWQPGWKEGNGAITGWSICLTENNYSSVIQKLHTNEVESYYQNPKWLNYWSYPVKDPMGNTVEVVLTPDQEPEKTVWQF